jgi:hypothetical protein
MKDLPNGRKEARVQVDLELLVGLHNIYDGIFMV